MASIKVLLYNDKTYSEWTNPLIIQITENRKTVKKAIHRCFEKQTLETLNDVYIKDAQLKINRDQERS